MACHLLLSPGAPFCSLFTLPLLSESVTMTQLSTAAFSGKPCLGLPGSHG